MSQDRRRQRRFRVAQLEGTLQFAHPTRIVDLSRSGAAIETTERLAPGRSYSLQLQSADGTTTSTCGRVIWCKLTGLHETDGGDSTPLYRAGLAFDEDLPGPTAQLLDQLGQARIEGVDTRLRARYKLSDLASTLLLEDRATFEVRTLSRGGMGAEMEYSPRVGSMLEFVLPLDAPVEIRGRVVDVHPVGESPRRFVVGIEFVGVAPALQGHLDRYVERLQARPGQRDQA